MRKKVLLFFIVCILLVASVFVACNKTSLKSTVDLSKVYQKAACASPWAKIADDESCIMIDTNPYDFDSDSYYYTMYSYSLEAREAIKTIHSELGIPDSLYQQMLKTNSLQGRQTKEFSSIGIEVSWTYHPNHGLEVTYSKIFD